MKRMFRIAGWSIGFDGHQIVAWFGNKSKTKFTEDFSGEFDYAVAVSIWHKVSKII